MVEKKVGSKKVGEKNQKIKKKSGVEKSKQAVVEVASEVLFGLVQNGALVWPRSKLPRNTIFGSPIRLLSDIKYFLIMLETSLTVFKRILGTI